MTHLRSYHVTKHLKIIIVDFVLFGDMIFQAFFD